MESKMDVFSDGRGMDVHACLWVVYIVLVKKESEDNCIFE